MSKCKYCGSSQYGTCNKSPHKHHEHVAGDSSHCIYCSTTGYGGTCTNSPTKKHKHHSDGVKCVWCGSKAVGSCPNSPTKRHER